MSTDLSSNPIMHTDPRSSNPIIIPYDAPQANLKTKRPLFKTQKQMVSFCLMLEQTHMRLGQSDNGDGTAAQHVTDTFDFASNAIEDFVSPETASQIFEKAGYDDGLKIIHTLARTRQLIRKLDDELDDASRARVRQEIGLMQDSCWQRFTSVNGLSVLTNQATINNPVGSGKSAALIGMVMTRQFPKSMAGEFTKQSSKFTQIFEHSSKPRFLRTLLVVGKGLIGQWCDAFEQFAGDAVRVQRVGEPKDVKRILKEHGEHGPETADTYGVTIVAESCYKDFADKTLYGNYRWARVVFDELHTCGNLGKKLVEGDFYWYINATIDKMCLYSSNISKQLLGNTADIQGGPGFRIQNHSQALAEEKEHPELRIAYLTCKPTDRLHPLARSQLNQDDMDELNANAVTWEQKKRQLLEKYLRKVQNIDVVIAQKQAEYNAKKANGVSETVLSVIQGSLDSLQQKKEEAEKAKTEATRNLNARFEEQCCVCLEDYDADAGRTQLHMDCGHFVCQSCAGGMRQTYASKYRAVPGVLFECPQCRQPVKSQDLQAIKAQAETEKTEKTETPLSKLETLIALIKGDRSSFCSKNPIINDLLRSDRHSNLRFVVTARYLATVQHLKDKFEAEGVGYVTLRAGPSLRLNMERLKKGQGGDGKNASVLIVRTETDGSGIDGLQFLCDDYVFVQYHKLSEASYKQSLGRILRYSGPGTKHRKVTVLSLCDTDSREYSEEEMVAANETYIDKVSAEEKMKAGGSNNNAPVSPVPSLEELLSSDNEDQYDQYDQTAFETLSNSNKRSFNNFLVANQGRVEMANKRPRTLGF